jgi:hypothetical protein
LTSEQSYLSGDDNLAPRQFRFDGHHQIKLMVAPDQFGPDPSKGSSNGVKRYRDRDIPASVSGTHAATTTFEVDGHLLEGLDVNSCTTTKQASRSSWLTVVIIGCSPVHGKSVIDVRADKVRCWPIVLKKSPGNFFEQISVMSTVQPIHDRAMLDVLDSRVTDSSLPIGNIPEFFNTIGR